MGRLVRHAFAYARRGGELDFVARHVAMFIGCDPELLLGAITRGWQESQRL
jgi:hypothetical protein